MKKSLTLCFVLFLIACGSGGLDFEDFRDQVASFAVDQAIDCGLVEVRADPETVNNCVTDAFNAGEPFYAVYELQGIDSFPAVAWVSNSVGELTQMTFDSDPAGGGRRDNGRIASRLCMNPKMIGSTDDPSYDLFLCS